LSTFFPTYIKIIIRSLDGSGFPRFTSYYIENAPVPLKYLSLAVQTFFEEEVEDESELNCHWVALENLEFNTEERFNILENNVPVEPSFPDFLTNPGLVVSGMDFNEQVRDVKKAMKEAYLNR
jgi:hypothetical protein